MLTPASPRWWMSLGLGLGLAGCVAPPPPSEEGSSSGDDGTTTVVTPGTGSSGQPPLTMSGSATSASSTGPAPGTTTMSSANTMSDEESGPPVIFDFSTPDMPPVIEPCGQLDLLFIIDNSGSMADEQAALAASFPTFITNLQAALPTVETYQVGVVTTDTYSYNIPGCTELSSLVVQTGGSQSSNALCGPYAAGDNFMTELDDLPTAFACASQVGTVGSASERPMQAMVEATQRIEGDPGECNEGFLRDEALLVIVVVTDEPDENSLGDPMTWYDDVLTAKLGLVENVVVISIINTPMGGCPNLVATNMSTFTTMWAPNALEIPICTPDYGPPLDDAVTVIAAAYENYDAPVCDR